MDFEAPILDLVRLSLESFIDDKQFINHFIDTFHSDDTFFVENENDMPAGVMHMLRFTDSKGHRAGYFYGLFTMLIHRRKGIGAQHIADDQRIHGIVQQLQYIADQKRQRKHDQLPAGIALK